MFVFVEQLKARQHLLVSDGSLVMKNVKKTLD